MDEQKINEEGVGPIIATVIILVVIILGGFYFWNQRQEMNTNRQDSIQTETTLSDEDIQAIEQQSASDDTASIDADLRSTNTQDLDVGLTQ